MKEPIYPISLPIGTIVELVLKGQVAKLELSIPVQFAVESYIKDNHITARWDGSRAQPK